MHWLTTLLGGGALGGIITAALGYLSKVNDNQSHNEKVYADHTDELFERIDHLTDERDKSNRQVVKLQAKIETQNRTISSLKAKVDRQNEVIDKMTQQIGELSEHIKSLSKLEQEEIKSNENSK